MYPINLFNNLIAMSLFLERIVEHYSEYINSNKYVYKSCGIEWIVILEWVLCAKHNEARSNYPYDFNFAKFRASKFKVIKIFNKFDPEKTIPRIKNTVYEKKTIQYVVNKIVVAEDYCRDIRIICAEGIHYYRSIIPAFFCELRKCEKYVGDIVEWYSDGSKCVEGHLENLKKTNTWIWFRDNDKKNYEGSYVNDKQNGLWTFYHENGNIKSKGFYRDNKRYGPWTFYHENGRKESEGYYIYDVKINTWTHWHDNGNLFKTEEHVKCDVVGKNIFA